MAERVHITAPPEDRPSHTRTSVPEPPGAVLRHERPRKRGLAWIWLLIFAGLGYGGYRFYQGQKEKQARATAAQAARSAPRPVPVVAVPARSGDLPVYLRGLGTVNAFNNVSVKSRVDGQLIALHFQEGQFVKQGDLMAEIDPRPFQVLLQQAEGQLARDTAQLNDAKANLGRFQALWDAKVIARQQLDTQAALVGQYEGTLEADRAAIASARLQLTYSRITAPLSGRVGLRQVDVGNIIHAGDANGIATIAQLQPIAVLFTITADDLPPVLAKLKAGAKLKVEAYDSDDRKLIATGTLLTVDNQIDPTTGTSRLKAVFPNTDGALFPNQFVNCHLLLDVKHGAILVPASAIQRGPQGSYVYVITPDKTADLRVVTIGPSEGNNVSIEKGVQNGETVVIDGQDKLQEKTKVEVRAPVQRPGARRSGA